jgi:beta-glucosidase
VADFPSPIGKTIREPIDWLASTTNTRSVVRHDPLSPPVYASPVVQPQATYTETGWEVHPASLERVLVWVQERYGERPIYVTENGAAFYDPPQVPPGGIVDPLRIDYYRTHLHAVRAAMRRGVDVRGYFAWSLLDNYEWAAGFSKRFGIVHVDYATQARTLKASARYYREVIRSRGAKLDEPPGIPGA